MITLKTENWEISGIDTVFFDKDGTFIDSNCYWGEIIKRRAKAATDLFRLSPDCAEGLSFAMGFDFETGKLLETGPVGICSRGEVVSFFTDALKKYGVSATFGQIDELFAGVHRDFKPEMNAYVHLLDGAEDLFKALKSKDVKLAVITSDARETTDNTLEKFGLKKYFDLVITKEDTAEPKHTGKPALLALEKLNSKAENTIAIGDAPMDVQMAKNAGLKAAVLVSTGQIGSESLKKASGFIVKNMKEIEVIL